MTSPPNNEGGGLSQKRAILGMVALGALGLSAVLYVVAAQGDRSLTAHAASLLRIGIVLGVFWLAVPNLDRIFANTPAWLWMTTLAGGAMMILRPWSAIWIVPLLTVIWGLSLTWLKKGK